MELLHVEGDRASPPRGFAVAGGTVPGVRPLSSDGRKGPGKAAPPGPADKDVRVCCDPELETSFTYVDENVNLQRGGPPDARPQELSLMSEDELASESSGTVDYGFIGAVTFLVTGISLVAISYAVPREVSVSPDSVSAREMERLEKESARIGAHLDRCVIAGLCLLTLGGAVLSTLLMISMWKGEMFRRKAFAYTKRKAKLYGSVSLRVRSSPAGGASPTSGDEDTAEFIS
ncbi:transmembrane protein 74-like [Arapaima gigas]